MTDLLANYLWQMLYIGVMAVLAYYAAGVQ